MEELNESIKKLTEAVSELTKSINQLTFKQESIIDIYPSMVDQISGLKHGVDKLANKIK